MAAFTNNLNFGVNLVPTSDSDGTLGASNKKWNLYVNYINGSAIGPSTVGLGNVENTKLSTWAGSSNLTTVGTISSGKWQGTAIASSYIGSHNHAAGDITSGTLAIARGGTNATSFTSNKALTYNGTSIVSKSYHDIADTYYRIYNDNSTNVASVYFTAKNSIRSVSLWAHPDGSIGVYDDTNSAWLIYRSTTNTTTTIPGNVSLGTVTAGTWNGTAIASSYIGSHNHAASNITSGQLGVANGGTGAASFTANSAIISGSTTTSALTTRAIHNLSAVGNLGWTSNINTNIATVGSIAYWNGAYSGTSSNLSVLGTITTGIWHGTAISLQYVNNWAFVGRNAEITANKNWYKVASCTINDGNEDRELVLHVYDTMVSGAGRSGILNVRVRTGAVLTSNTPTLNLVWEYNNGLPSTEFKLVSSINTSPCTAELWTNVPYNWIGRVFTVIRMGTRTLGQSDSWTLYKNYSSSDNGATGSTSSLTNSVTASYLDFYSGTINATYKMPASGVTYGILYKNNDGNLAVASNLYFPDNGYTLRNQAPSGYSPAFQASGPTKAISLMVNSADTNRGLYDTTIDNWLMRLDTDNNVYINSGGTNSNINLNAQGTGAIAANKSIVASGDVYSGYSTDATTRRAGTRSVGGRLFLYTEGTATATSGLWFYNNAGTGRGIIAVPQTGNAKFFGGIVDQYDNSKTITARYYGSGQAATDWVCMWTDGSGGNGDIIGAVSIVDAVDKAIIYSSSTPTVVNGKLWLKPV